MPHNAPISPLSVLVVYGDIAAGTTLARSGAAHDREAAGARLRSDLGALGRGRRGGDPVRPADGLRDRRRRSRSLRRRRDRVTCVSREQRPHTGLPLRAAQSNTRDTASHAQVGRRVRLAHRRHADVHCGPRRGRDQALPREPAAADVLRHARASKHARVRVRHAGAPGRHGVSQDSGVEGVFRLLRREPVSLGSLDRHGRRGLAARSQRADRREREIRGARVRRPSLLYRHERHFELQPHHLHGEPHAGRRRAVRPQLPQVHRARVDHEPGDAGVSRAAPQPLRHHRPDLPRGFAAQDHSSALRRASVEGRSHRAQAATHGDHELDLRRVDLQRGTHHRDRRGRHRPAALRRGLVRLRAVQPAVPQPSRDVRRRRRLQERPDVVCDPFDAQAARGALAGVVHSHSRRPGSDRACALQRVVHDACFDLAVLSDHRVERNLRRDDGRRERRCVDHRGDPRSGELSTDDGPHQAAVRGGRRLVLRHLERERGHRSQRRSSAWRSKTRPKTY